MKKKYFSSLSSVIMLSTLIIALLAISLVTFSLNQRFSDAIQASTEKNNRQIIDNVSDNIDQYIQEMMDITSQVSSNSNTFMTYKERSLDSLQFSLRTDIENIMIADAKGNVAFHTSKYEFRDSLQIENQEWFKSITPGSVDYNLTTPYVQQIYKGKYNWVISLSHGLTWQEDTKKKFGVVTVDLNIKNIQKLCSQELGNNGQIFILDKNNDIVYHPQQQAIYAGIENIQLETAQKISKSESVVFIDGKKMLVTQKQMKNAPWRVVGISMIPDIFTFDFQMKNFIIFLIILVTIFIIIISMVSSLFITKPIYRLINLMAEVESGDIESYAEISGFYEVEQLSASYNQMLYQIKILMERRIRDQENLSKAEMRVLYNQINPHFLYNTLDSIIWLAESNKREEVIKTIDSLANFFRLSLANGKEEISVANEVEHVKNYLEIQKIRYVNQFDYDIFIDNNVYELKTLKIILQPIVENSIIHGFGDFIDVGQINISIYKEEGKLIYKISDNGCGIPMDIVEILNNDNHEEGKNGIGLKNIKERIQITYGKKYGLFVESELEEGTVITVSLPINHERKKL